MKHWAKLACVSGLLGVILATTACQNQVRVDRWVEVPCQPHGFYIAFKGQSLKDVAQACQVSEPMLVEHNKWLVKHQPFKENTVVWLKKDPNAPVVEEDLTVHAIEKALPVGFGAEALTPLNLPSRVAPAKQNVPRLSAH